MTAVLSVLYHIAVGSIGVLGIAATWLTASLCSKVPVVVGTLVTVMAHHMGPAWAGPSSRVAAANLPVAVSLEGARCHACTPCSREGKGHQTGSHNRLMTQQCESNVPHDQSCCNTGADTYCRLGCPTDRANPYTPMQSQHRIGTMTHVCSLVLARCRSNHACIRSRRGRRCCTGTSGTALSGGHMTQGPGGRCCGCTRSSGTRRPAFRGPRNTQERSGHSEGLDSTEEGADHV